MKPVGHAWGAVGLLLAADTAVFTLQKAASRTADAGGTAFFQKVVLAPELWLAVILAPVQLVLWTRILKRSDIGWAYPLTAITYPVTMVAAVLLFEERYDPTVWAGAMLITLGAAIIGPQRSSEPAGGQDSAVS